MREAFNQQVETLQVIEEPQQKPKVGLEVEFCVIQDNKPASSEPFMHLPFIDVELGDSHLELRTEPVVMNTLTDLYVELSEKERILRENCNGTQVMRLGAHPFLKLDEVIVSDKEKYRIVPNFHDTRRGPHINTTIGGCDFSKANCMSLFCSTQTNLQADSLDDAIDKLNRSFMISPFLVAVSGNARIIEGKDTNIEDIRILVWEASHDIRNLSEIRQGKETRVGLQNNYIDSIDDYFKRISQHPFILDNPEAALPIATGLCWWDCRIKFIDNNPIVEYRAISTQPSVKEDMALAVFYIGRLAYSQHCNEPLMEMEKVKYNRHVALEKGLQSKLYCNGRLMNAKEAVALELEKAKQGLHLLGYNQEEIREFTDVIDQRLATGRTPSQIFAEQLNNISIEEAVEQYHI